MSACRKLSRVSCRDDLVKAIDQRAFLPFFHQDGIVSLEDLAAPEIWFTEQEGPWEWKASLSREKKCVYGKYAYGSAVFVAPDVFPELIRIRRDGYDFEGMWEDGLISRTAGDIMRTVMNEGPSIAKHIRRILGNPKDFDHELVRLQMLTFLVHADFIYDIDRHGHPYGWGNALLDTPEHFFGEDYVNQADSHSSEEAVLNLCSRMGEDSPAIRAMLMGKRTKKTRSN